MPRTEPLPVHVHLHATITTDPQIVEISVDDQVVTDDNGLLLERWVEWRCECGRHLCDYNAYEPCHLKKDCPNCKKHQTLDRRRRRRRE